MPAAHCLARCSTGNELWRAIINAEVDTSQWTLMHRFHKAADIINEVGRRGAQGTWGWAVKDSSPRSLHHTTSGASNSGASLTAPPACACAACMQRPPHASQ